MRHLVTLFLFLAVGLFGCTASTAGPTRVAINNPNPGMDIYLGSMAPSSGSEESGGDIRRNVPKDFRTPVAVGAANEIPQRQDGMGIFSSETALKDFKMEVEFVNPRSRWEGAWDYGVLFRTRSPADGFHVYVDSDGEWGFRYGGEQAKQTGTLEKWNVEAGSTNRLRLIVLDTTAFFFVNDVFVAVLDVSRYNGVGTISVGTGFLPAHSHDETQTKFEGFRVWDLASQSMVTDGRLEIDRNETKARMANFNRPNFIAQATFRNPSNVQSNWDYGFAFRHTGPKHYYALVLTKQGRGILQYMTEKNGAPKLERETKLSPNKMLVGPSQPNKVVLYVNGANGILVVNGEPVAPALDVSQRLFAGDVQVVANVAGATSAVPFAIEYSDFKVVPIP